MAERINESHERDPSVVDQFQALSEKYRDIVSDSHAISREITERDVENGLLPKEYVLPELVSGFAEQAIVLAPFYEMLAGEAQEPIVEFVPKNVTFEQFDESLKSDRKSSGIWCKPDDVGLIPFAGNNLDNSLWDMVVISAVDKPMRGFVGSGTRTGRGYLSYEFVERLKLFSADDDNVIDMISELSPSVGEYLTLQRNTLLKNGVPLDTSDRTICKSKIVVNGVQKTICGFFIDNQVNLCSYDHFYFDDAVVRITFNGRDLLQKIYDQQTVVTGSN